MAMQFYSPIGLEESVTNTTATNSVELGFRAIYKGEEYVYCYNAGSDEISTGNGVRFVTGASGYSVTASGVTDSVNPCVGVCNNATIATGYYGWIMAKGFRNVVMTSATTGSFLPICLGDAGEFVQFAPLTDAVNIGTFVVAGYAMNANTGAGGSVYAAINTGF